MATKNSINNTSNPFASTAITIDPGASGDPTIKFAANTVDKFIMGVDDNDSDALVISVGSSLGTTNAFRMSSAGEMNLPLTPGFVAVGGGADDVTGDGTAYDIGSSAAMTEIIDQNGDFSPGDGAGTAASFTAPVDGNYYFSWGALLQPSSSAEFTLAFTGAASGGGTNLPGRGRVANFFSINSRVSGRVSSLVDLDASDLVNFRYLGDGGSKLDDYINSNSVVSGVLIS
jgi:hypothetical protein